MPPRVALLGYGYWGRNLARNLHALLGAEWVACADPDPERRAEASFRYPWLTVSAMAEGALADPGVDAVVVATPAQSHFALVRDALAAGKHVLVEKPLALAAEEAAALARAADA